MNLLSILTDLENSNELHLSRLLILIFIFSGNNGDEKIEGLTKLAKLDFLLRYPEYLEKALLAKKKSIKKLHIMDFERKSIESAMVRYRYGPWDFRYRKLLNILISLGLVNINQSGRTYFISITELGQKYGKELSGREEFLEISDRSYILKKHFNLKATTLMNFIYETFPEIGNLRFGEEIK